MTTEILKFPEQTIRPDLANCYEAIAICDGDLQKLLFLAFNALHLVYTRAPAIGGDEEQTTINRLTISFLALGRLIGVFDMETPWPMH